MVKLLGLAMALLLAGAGWYLWSSNQQEPGGLLALAYPRGEAPDACDGQAPPPGDMPRLWGFNYGGRQWCFTASFPAAADDAYADDPHQATVKSGYGPFVNAPNDDVFIEDLVAKFRAAAQESGWGEHETVDFVVTFVQSLPYTSDVVTAGVDEYVRYPVETLVADGGDCEDTSVLLAALLREMGYGVVLLGPPGHLAVGVKVAPANAAQLDTVQWNGSVYAYVETTGDGWSIGEIPPEWSGRGIEVFEV